MRGNKHLFEMQKELQFWEVLIQAETQIMFQLGSGDKWIFMRKGRGMPRV